ncbi:ATP-binding protein [Clostridium intestinale]|uniref:histidine kinase n=2 Tax=Clostridium intestinale TaxID=36845 RepID=U2NUD0_9CLOT|nr:ATP-binding protein [Clostridium intestinale]ERK32476.1 sensor histidine kinase [Clostridium intestinale URNW]QLY79449.1 two-component sensor histidine kinase [Clostridium intestinale]
MQSIRRKLSILLATSSIAAILLITLFVNININIQFNKYMLDTQNKRYERIVDYFKEIYKRDRKWSEASGGELIHEAYMGNYCLTLFDENRNVVWGMNPSDMRFTSMGKDKGVYTSNTYEIKIDEKVVGFVDIGQYSSLLLSEEDINFKTSINTSIAISGIITVIIIFIVSLYFSKQFSSPIKDAVNMSVNLSKGNFDLKSDTKSNIEELENLRNSTNILAKKLNYQDVLRRRLVSDISHEIRTPLNILQNNLEAMIDGIFPVTTERLNYLNEEVIRFGKLLDNLNTLKEFESESIKLNFQVIVLDEFLMEIFREFYIHAKDKGIKMFYNVDFNNNYALIGDKDKLKQVFINLISNAIKFSRSGDTIQIDLYADDTNITIKFKDTGMGIKEEDLPFIFERLYRGDKSRHHIEGTGIGLTIVKSILKLHFADIDVESKENIGTTFTIKFNRLTKI